MKLNPGALLWLIRKVIPDILRGRRGEAGMPQTIRAKIGFISAISPTSPHFNSFRPLIPEDIQMDLEGLGLVGKSLYDDLKGKMQSIVNAVSNLATRHQWDGLIVSGAPVELLNPGLLREFQAAIEIPVTTAMGSCVAALKAFSARRVLLMTPFDEPMNKMLRDYLGNSGIEAVSPPPLFGHFTDAMKVGPEDVYLLTKNALEGARGVEAIYFQGAVLDPLEVLQRLEEELHTTVVASNPAMLWFILSKLGLRYQIRDYGKLLQQWCKLPVG